MIISGKKFIGSGNIKVVKSAIPTIPNKEKRKNIYFGEGGLAEKVGGVFKKYGQGVIDIYKQTPGKIVEDIEAGAKDIEEGKKLKGIAKVGLRTAGDVAGAIFAPVMSAFGVATEETGAQKVIDKIGEFIGDKVSASKFIQDFAMKHPNAEEDFNRALMLLLSTGEKGTIEPKRMLDEAKGIITKPISGTGQFLAQKAGQLAEPLKLAGEKTTGLTMTMEEPTKIQLQNYQANQPRLIDRIKSYFTGEKIEKIGEKPITEARTAVRLLQPGTEWQLGVDAKRISRKLWDDIVGPALRSDKTPISKNEFFDKLEKRIIKENVDLSRRQVVLRAFESFKDSFKFVSNFGLEKLQNYKSGWSQFIPEKAYKGEPIAGALNEVRNFAAQEARNIIYERLGNDIKQAYWDYGNLESIAEAGRKSIDPLRSKGITRQVWEAILDKVITPITTISGKVLYKTGEGFEFIGEAGAKKVKDIINTPSKPLQSETLFPTFGPKVKNYIKNPKAGLSIQDISKGITTKIEPRGKAGQIISVDKNGKNIANFIFGEPDKRLGLVNPEMRFTDPITNKSRAIRFAGTTPEAIQKELPSILEKYKLITPSI